MLGVAAATVLSLLLLSPLRRNRVPSVSRPTVRSIRSIDSTSRYSFRSGRQRSKLLLPSCSRVPSQPPQPSQPPLKGPVYDARRNIPPEQFITQPRAGGNKINGSHRWDQTFGDVHLYLEVDKDIKGKDIDIKLKPLHILVKARGDVVFNSSLAHEIKTFDPTWIFEDHEDDTVEGNDELGGSSHNKKTLNLMLRKEREGLIWDEFVRGEASAQDLTLTDIIYMDFEVQRRIIKDGAKVLQKKELGRVTFGLFGAHEPRMVKLFMDLVGSTLYGINGSIGYNDSAITRVEPARYLMGGALKSEEENTGISLPQNFQVMLPSSGPGQIGLVCDTHGNPDTRFVISTGADGINDTDIKTVTLGRVIQGMHIILEMEKRAAIDAEGRPGYDFVIANCGFLDPSDHQTTHITPFCLQSSKLTPRY